MLPKFPIYIISKGRAESRLTAKALERMACPYKIVIEPQEFDLYAKHIPAEKIIVLPFSNLGQGSIPARNFVWKHSIDLGYSYHWILDDNIRGFYRFHNNKRLRLIDPICFALIEIFVERYTNIWMAGMQYKMFCPSKSKFPVFKLNTRIYSNILLNNECPFRWRGRYNEDTDLSLRILKNKKCTILFNAFLADKIATMQMKGGNTDELYLRNSEMDGRYLMAKSLRQQHPDVTRIIWRWNRWQHHVDYSKFNHKLIRKNGLIIKDEPNEYGLTLFRQNQ